ncbi:MAG: hypothetical protein ACOYIF_07165 [Acetivibrionales bacterium]|jgi:hypothetical protein
MKLFIKSNKGITLPVAIMVTAIVFMFVFTLLTLSENLTRNVSFRIDREDALQIAEAGYNHFMYYLNQDSTFYLNPDGTAGIDDETGFIPGTDDDSGDGLDSDGLPIEYKETPYKRGNDIIGYYKIRLIQPNVNEDLSVISTGYTVDKPDIKRTVQVKIHQRSFTEYVDFSDSSGEVYWTSNDEAHGPVFCNEDLLIKGNPVFHDDVVIGGKIKVLSGSPTFNPSKLKLENQPKLLFPVTNDEIISWGESEEGLSFTGRTCILFIGNKLQIRNKNINNDEIKTYDLPECGVLLVKNGSGSNAGNVFISGTLDGRLTVYAEGNIYITGKDPTNYSPNSIKGTFSKDEGGIKYADDNIPLIGSSGKKFSNDMLGLISEGHIIIATRTWPSTDTSGYSKLSESSVSVKNITVYGALMTNKAGKQIYVEDYADIDPKGNFTVYGSKIQNAERGAVGTFSSSTYDLRSGYRKVNYFDYRLRNQTPPHFITPDKSGWEVREWEEILNP